MNASGTPVGTPLKATDEDQGQLLLYLIVIGESFAVDPYDGQIAVTRGDIIFETRIEYTLRVQAADTGHPSLSAFANVYVLVVDVNEAPVRVDCDVARHRQ